MQRDITTPRSIAVGTATMVLASAAGVIRTVTIGGTTAGISTIKWGYTMAPGTRMSHGTEGPVTCMALSVACMPGSPISAWPVMSGARAAEVNRGWRAAANARGLSVVPGPDRTRFAGHLVGPPQFLKQSTLDPSAQRLHRSARSRFVLPQDCRSRPGNIACSVNSDWAAPRRPGMSCGIHQHAVAHRHGDRSRSSISARLVPGHAGLGQSVQGLPSCRIRTRRNRAIACASDQA